MVETCVVNTNTIHLKHHILPGVTFQREDHVAHLKYYRKNRVLQHSTRYENNLGIKGVEQKVKFTGELLVVFSQQID